MEIDEMLNIRKSNIEDVIQEAILSVQKKLEGLSKERTCMIYSSYLYEALRKRGVLCRLIDTKVDLGMKYQHQFITVFKDKSNRYVIDFTYEQFGEYDKFSSMYLNGYQLLSSELYQEYLFHIDEVTYQSNKRK